MLINNRFLSEARLKLVFTLLADQLEVRRPLMMLQRLTRVNADDDEIIGRFVGRYLAADIVADDQRAIAYEGGYFELTTNQIPNLKFGMRFPMSTLRRMDRIRRNLATDADVAMMGNWEYETAKTLLWGVRSRANQLACAMFLDALIYDRGGVKINGTWGMPSNLKPAAATSWADATNGNGVQDVNTLVKDTAAETLGIVYNRLTLSTTTLYDWTAQSKFQAQMSGVLSTYLPVGAFDARDPRLQTGLARVLGGVTIETYDGHITVKTAAGNYVNQRVLPHGEVLIDSTENDNDPSVMDWASGTVSEALVQSIVGDPDNMEGTGGEEYGPIAYWTGSEELNPATLKAWAVDRGFPRKHNPNSTAVLTAIPQPAALLPA